MAPVAKKPTYSAKATEGKAFSYFLPKGTFTGGDKGDVLTYSVDNLPSWLTVDAKTGKLTGTVDYAAADDSPLSLVVRATDASGASATTSLTLTIANVATIKGSAKADSLVAGAGNDAIDGLAGADTMSGGAGNDTYVVDHIGDVVLESANNGTDLIRTSLASFDLIDWANIEQLTYIGKTNAELVGSDNVNTLTGAAKNDTLEGGGGADTLYGGAGDDWLSGFYLYEDADLEDADFAALVAQQAGVVDHLYGGKGNDFYLLDQYIPSGSVIHENANEGTDTILGDLERYVLDAHVENYVQDRSIYRDGEAIEIPITGNELNNLIKSSPADWDSVKAILGTTNQDWVAKEAFYGLGGNDTLISGGGDDVLDGGQGNDVLHGGRGRDTLTGGSGSDRFVFDTELDADLNLDRVADFTAKSDKIVLSAAIFTALKGDKNLADNLYIKTIVGTDTTQDANDVLVWDLETSTLAYDADGSGTKFSAIAFVTLIGVTALSGSDLAML